MTELLEGADGQTDVVAKDVLPTPACPTPGSGQEAPAPFAGNPELAWKALLLVVDWIKYAEVKAGGSIAAAGVLAGLLYNLVKSQSHPAPVVAGTAVVATILTGLTACLAHSSSGRAYDIEKSRRALSSSTTLPGSTASLPPTSQSSRR